MAAPMPRLAPVIAIVQAAAGGIMASLSTDGPIIRIGADRARCGAVWS
jgi:hypothetical protein